MYGDDDEEIKGNAPSNTYGLIMLYMILGFFLNKLLFEG